MDYLYPVDVSIDEEGFHLVIFPDFPECATDGKTRAEALREAADALEEAIAGRIFDKEDFPVASPPRGRPVVSPGARIAAKAALYEAFRAAAISKAELARRLDVDKRDAKFAQD